MDRMDRRTQSSNYRTGRLQECRCTAPPYPYELEGSDSKVALEATVLRAAFRKHNSCVRSAILTDNGSWNLPLNVEEPLPPLREDLTQRLPMEILDQILSTVYNETQTSNDICICSRRDTPYGTIRLRSLKHRVIDSFAMRLTCSRWHHWALKYVLSGVVGGEFIELDISNLASFDSMRFPAGGLGMRLFEDFPFLRHSGIALYLGNPGEVYNMILVKEMLEKARIYGGPYCQIFSGVSFWDLDYLVKDTLPRWAWNVDGLILLDILSHFLVRPILSHIQFPTTIFATLPQTLWRPVLKGLLRRSDKISLREFQLKLDPPHPVRWYRSRAGFLQDSNSQIDQLLEICQRNEYTEPESITRHCKELHSITSFGPQRDWRRLRHLRLSLKSFDAEQEWRIDDTFLEKFGPCNLNRLVSVTVDGGLASRLTISGLFKLLEPSSSTLQKLVFIPADADPGIEAHGTKHHCQLLSPSNMGGQFPRLDEVELHIPCCPDIFFSGVCLSSKQNLRKRWKIKIPRGPDGLMGFCQNWIGRNMPLRNLDGPDPLKWNYITLSEFFEAARTGRNNFLSGEMKQVTKLRGQPLINKWAEISDLWKIEIQMEKASITTHSDVGGTNLIFRPLELPRPKMRSQTIGFIAGNRDFRRKPVDIEVYEDTFIKGMGAGYIT